MPWPPASRHEGRQLFGGGAAQLAHLADSIHEYLHHVLREEWIVLNDEIEASFIHLGEAARFSCDDRCSPR